MKSLFKLIAITFLSGMVTHIVSRSIGIDLSDYESWQRVVHTTTYMISGVVIWEMSIRK